MKHSMKHLMIELQLSFDVDSGTPYPDMAGIIETISGQVGGHLAAVDTRVSTRMLPDVGDAPVAGGHMPVQAQAPKPPTSAEEPKPPPTQAQAPKSPPPAEEPPPPPAKEPPPPPAPKPPPPAEEPKPPPPPAPKPPPPPAEEPKPPPPPAPKPPPAPDPQAAAPAVVADEDIVLEGTRHAGKTLGWVRDNDPEYFKMMRSFVRDESVKAAVARLQGKTPDIPPPPPPPPAAAKPAPAPDAGASPEDADEHQRLTEELLALVRDVPQLQNQGVVTTLLPWLQQQPELEGKYDFTVLPLPKLRQFADRFKKWVASLPEVE